ncbi:MAG: EAL domain-containing protein [Desulfosalsimonadaceae bacterium]
MAEKTEKKTVILIIDHDPGARRDLTDSLKVKGYDTLAAGNGADGLALLQNSAVNLALIDLGLRDISGLDLVSQIRADHPSTAMIVLTDNAGLESALEATNRGAFTYLVKPYLIDQLMLKVRRAIEKQQTDAALRESEAKLRDLVELAPDAILIVNDKQEILRVNRQFEEMFGYHRSEVVGKHMGMLIPPRFVHHMDYNRDYIRNPKIRRMGQGKEACALLKDGSELPVEIALSPLETPEGLIVTATIRDITERKRYEAQLEYQANHDWLTGLTNRNLLMDRLSQALLHAEYFRRQVAVLFVDLDHFKLINDSLGFDMGDRILKIAAERLAACVRANDTVARQGGDDFVIVLSDLVESQDAAAMAQKIQAALNQPLEIDTHFFKISCSIGISIYPKDGKDVQTLLKNADVAMFRAKEQGRSIFQFFIDELNDKVVARMTMEKHLRRALENDELSVHYQPQMDMAAGQMTGIEALLRWQSPGLGMVSPADFIPLAEETGLIIPIGEWVLKTACMQNRKLQDAGFPPLVIAVNLSPRQFWYPGILETISRILQDSNLEPRYLELEITEGMVMRDVENAMVMLNELKGLGVQLAMDDFGTGYSNLSYLKRFPFDKIKMDISFVREVTHDPGCAAIAKTIIALAHNLDLRVIAEGIETEGQLSYLRAQHCDEMQGFYFSKPLPCRDLEQLLREGRILVFPKEGNAHPERTLLLVDDEPSILKVIEQVLSKDGYRILSTTSTSRGFEMLATNRVGVVLCDQRMPGMDGIEFLSRVSRIHPETIRIAMSGYADMAMVTGAINQGAIYKFLTKPMDNKLLRQSIAKAFERFETASGGEPA